MKTLYESILDKDFDITDGDLLFHSLMNYPFLEEEDCLLEGNNNISDMTDEIIGDNISHMEDIDPVHLIDRLVNNIKFLRLAKKMKCSKGCYIDLPETIAPAEFIDVIYDRYWDFHNKRIGKVEFSKKLPKTSLIFEIFSMGGYYFTYLYGSDNVIYGFIMCD